MRCLIKTAAALGAAALLSACTSKGVGALDDLTTSTTNDGGLRKPISLNYPLQTRFLSVNGQLPVPHIGSSCLASSQRVANSIICFSTTGETKVLTRSFKYGGGEAGVKAYRDSLEDLQLTVAQLIEIEAANNRMEDDENTPPQALVESQNAAKALADEVTEKSTELAKESRDLNIFVFRWAGSKSGNANGSFGGSFLSGSTAANSTTGGLVIVGGLHVSQLLIGDDFETTIGKQPDAAKVATLTMAADYLLYAADSSLSAALEASLETDLKTLSKELSPETKVALRAYASISQAEENQGFFSKPKYDFLSLEKAYSDTDPGQIFYATLTDVETLKESIK